MEEDKRLYIGIAIGCFVSVLLMSLLDTYNTKQENIPLVEHKTDTLYITKDSIIHNIEYIKIIQHDTIEKIYNLDDTTSVKLFYELVSE